MDAGRRVRTNMRKTNTENRHRIFLGVAHIIFFIDIILVYSRCRHEQFEHMEKSLVTSGHGRPNNTFSVLPFFVVVNSVFRDQLAPPMPILR